MYKYKHIFFQHAVDIIDHANNDPDWELFAVTESCGYTAFFRKLELPKTNGVPHEIDPHFYAPSLTTFSMHDGKSPRTNGANAEVAW